LLPRGISGAMLARLEDGWAALLDEAPDIERVATRGALLFDLAAKLLDESHPKLAAAGRLFACQQVARTGLVRLPYPTEELHLLARLRFPRTLRPLTALSQLAARDVKMAPIVEPEAVPGRAFALIRHRLSGIVA
jgi:phytoene synthase